MLILSESLRIKTFRQKNRQKVLNFGDFIAIDLTINRLLYRDKIANFSGFLVAWIVQYKMMLNYLVYWNSVIYDDYIFIKK